MKRVPWWVWASFMPIGFGAWAPIIPGLALHRRAWTAWGALWTVIAVFGFVASTLVKGDWPGGPLVLSWIGGAATALAIRPAYERELAEPFAARIVALRERINGFESLEDLGMVLDLDGDAVERLRDHTVFLPR